VAYFTRLREYEDFMSKACVLVADDSVTIQKVFELAFEGEDIDIMVASDGKSALSMALSQKPDMIIADVNMPEMDGFELCQAIKKNPGFNSVPVYLLSSALDDFDDDMAKKVGASGRFEKPFRSEDMVKQVMGIIRAPSGKAGAAFAQGFDDTFDDIDISLDGIIDSLDSTQEGDKDTEPAFDTPWDDVKEQKAGVAPQALPPTLAGGASIKILDLVDDASDEDDEGGDEDLGVETLTGSETDMDLGLTEYPTSDDALASFDDGDEIVITPAPAGDSGGAGLDAVIPSYDDDVGEIGDDLSEEAQAMIRAIEDEEPLITARPPRPDAQMGGASPVTQATMEDAVKRAVELAMGGMDITSVAERAVRSAVADAFAGGVVRDGVETAVKAFMVEMAPTLLESFSKVAEEVTLNVAETLVKQTIDQIKSGD
jgi:CheY-like chemotaxis protein